MDTQQAVAAAKKYSDVVSKRFKVREIRLFGSRADRTAPVKDDSDIDIAVVVDSLDTDFLDFSRELYRIRRDISMLIEPVLLISDKDASGFLAEIRATGQVLYSR